MYWSIHIIYRTFVKFSESFIEILSDKNIEIQWKGIDIKNNYSFFLFFKTNTNKL